MTTTNTTRDELAALMYSTFTSMPDGCCLTEKIEALASIALAFNRVEHKTCELEQAQRARREKALLAALAQALRTVESVDLGESLKITDRLVEDVDPLPGGPLDLNCSDHVVLFPVLAGTLGEFAEKLVDYFSRQHEPRLARERAEGVIELLREHLEVSA
jgi:hypothetical protein